MKKILFTILAAAAMSAACTKFAEDVVPAYDTVGKPLVDAKVAGDDSLTVVITAGENTHYYGYVVVEGVLEDVKVSKLVSNGYAKDAAVVLQGEEKTPQSAYYKYSKETKADTLYLSGLTPFTDYTVYAAAVSPMGVESEVVAVTVKTTDGTTPVVDVESAEFEEADSVLTFAIPFSDPIALTGEGTAKAYFYGENYADAEGYLVVYKEVEIPETHMATSGNYLILAVPAEEYIPGAFVSMTYSADIVVNGAGAKNAAFDKNLMAWIEGELLWNGIVGQYEYVNWDFSLVDPATLPDEEEGEGEMEDEEEEDEEEEKIPVYFGDWTKLMMLNYTTSDFALAGKTGDGGVTITTEEASGKTISYPGKSFGVIEPDNIVAVMLDEEPAYGSTVSYTFEEGTICDIFGNVNNEFTAEEEYYYSYGYTLDDIVGTYACSVSSFWYGPYPETLPLTIEPYEKSSEEDLDGNVKITNYMGVECDMPIVGTFDMDAGFLTIPSGQVYALAIPDYVYGEDGYPVEDGEGGYLMTSYMGVFMVNAVPSVTLQVYEPGTLCDPSAMFGIYGVWEDESEGWYDAFKAFEAVRTEQAPAPAPAPAARRAAKKLL